MTVAAAIIGGGRALRLGGRPKHLIEIGGRRIVDRQLDSLRQCFDQVIVVAPDAASWAGLGLPVVPDLRPAGSGPLAGLESALAAVAPAHNAVVCVACDMPFLDPRALALLRDHAPEADACVPRVGALAEPLFARYATRSADIVRARLTGPDHSLVGLLAQLTVAWIEEPTLRAIDPDLRFLLGVNTSADVERAEAIASAGAGATLRP